MSASRRCGQESSPNISLPMPNPCWNMAPSDGNQLQRVVQNVRLALHQLQSIDLASYDAIKAQNALLTESLKRVTEQLEFQQAAYDRLRELRDDFRTAFSETRQALSDEQKKAFSLKADMRVLEETLSRERNSHSTTRQELAAVSAGRDNLLRESARASAEMEQLRQQLAATQSQLQQARATSSSLSRQLQDALWRERVSTHSQQQCPSQPAGSNGDRNVDAEGNSASRGMDPEKDDEARQAALRESMEKLRRIQEQENRDRLKRKREQDDEEERQRQERAKRQRLAEEQEREMLRRRAEEEQRRQAEEAQRRQQEQADDKQKADAWREATKQEEIRCQKRDIRNWTWPKLTSSALPPSSICLARFIFVLEEFSGTQYSETQPVTISSVPWPVLLTPRHITFDVLDETKIRAFFAYAKTVHSSADYKKLLSKARIQFHPDKWRSRNLLKTIMKEGIRETMESTVTVVSQTLNALVVEA